MLGFFWRLGHGFPMRIYRSASETGIRISTQMVLNATIHKSKKVLILLTPLALPPRLHSWKFKSKTIPFSFFNNRTSEEKAAFLIAVVISLSNCDEYQVESKPRYILYLTSEDPLRIKSS